MGQHRATLASSAETPGTAHSSGREAPAESSAGSALDAGQGGTHLRSWRCKPRQHRRSRCLPQQQLPRRSVCRVCSRNRTKRAQVGHEDHRAAQAASTLPEPGSQQRPRRASPSTLVLWSRGDQLACTGGQPPRMLLVSEREGGSFSAAQKRTPTVPEGRCCRRVPAAHPLPHLLSFICV